MRRFFAGRYKAALAKRAAEGTLRSTTVRTEPLIDFASNDYLGVARDASFFRSGRSRLRWPGDRWFFVCQTSQVPARTRAMTMVEVMRKKTMVMVVAMAVVLMDSCKHREGNIARAV